MKADLRIPIKDYHRNKNLKTLLHRRFFPSRQLLVRMNGSTWPKTGQSVSFDCSVACRDVLPTPGC